MAYVRLFRRVHLAPGVTLNLATRGPSLSFGVRGAHVTVGRSGVRRTVGLPGTGIFVTSRHGWHSGVHSAAAFGKHLPAPETQERTLNVLLVVLIVIVVIVALVALAGH
jgi:hypothetical protein